MAAHAQPLHVQQLLQQPLQPRLRLRQLLELQEEVRALQVILTMMTCLAVVVLEEETRAARKAPMQAMDP